MISCEKTKKFIKIAFPFLFFFCIFFIFYTKFYPLYIYDTDDWAYITAFRHAIPIPCKWNPTRVMPETIMPLISRLSALCIMPFNGNDLTQALADGFAIFFSAVISAYFCTFVKFFQKKFNLKYCYSFVIVLLMLFLHFCTFKFADRTCNNQHIFLSLNVCSMFYYVLAFLIATIFVTILSTHDRIKKYDNTKLLQMGLVLLFAYLVINSNMFQSIVLAAFIASGLVLELFASLHHKKQDQTDFVGGLNQIFTKNCFDITLLIVWFVAIALEATGGRAGCYVDFNIKYSLVSFGHTLVNMNIAFLVVSFVSILLGMQVFHVERKKNQGTNSIDSYFAHMTIRLFLAMIFSIIYLILLGAKVGGGYITRADVICSWLIWIIWLVAISWAYIASKRNFAFIFLPLVIYIVFFETMDSVKFQYCNFGSHSPELVKALNQNTINQVLKANSEGKNYVEVHVPSYPNAASKDNWPLALYGGNSVSDALFDFGLTRDWIDVKFVPDQNINKKFGIK